MKQTNIRRSSHFVFILASLLGVAALGLHAATAASVFWDSNGATDGAGDPAAGTWGTDSFWNTDSAGGAGTFTTAVGATNAAIFSAGSDAVSAFTVTVAGTNLTQSVTFQEGTPTLSGAGVIALTKATSSGNAAGTLRVDATLAGTATVGCGVDIDAVASGNSILQLVANDSAGASPDLLISGPVRKLGTTGTVLIRLAGAGSGRITSPLTSFASIQPLFASPAMNGTWTIAGNQTMTGGAIDFPSGTTVGANAQYVMGDSLADVQSWASMNLDNGTPTLAVIIRSTATMSGSMTIGRGAEVQIPGALTSLGTLNIGNASGTGTLLLSDGVTAGSASYAGLSVGAFLGSSIVGGAAGMSTLTLSNNSAATVTGNLTIGGGGDNDNVQLNKKGAGTLTLGGAHSYVGATLVTGGRLELTGTIASSVTVSNNASLGGEGSTTGTITFGSGTANLFFDPVTGGFLTANTISANGTVIVNPNSSTAGVVMQSTTTPNGITGTIGVNYLSGARGSLSLNGTGDTLSFTPTTAANLTWKGSAANPTLWDVLTTTNWNNGTERFYSGDSVMFDDSASSFSVAIQNGSVAPGNTIISNHANAYTLSTGAIIGTGGLTKNGSGAATILSGGHAFSGGLTVNNGTLNLWSSSANTFTGGVTNNGGTLVVSNMNQLAATTAASPNAINLNGGTLSYGGPTFSQTTDTLGLNLLGGVSTLDVSNTNNVTLRVGAAVTGTGDLIKTGAGTLALGRNTVQSPLGNTFTGKITVTGGQLDIRQQDSLGATSGITEFTNATLYLDPFGQPSGMTYDAEPLVFSGNSYIRNFNQSATVYQLDVLTGPITNHGTLGIFSQTNGGYGELQITGNIVNGPGSAINFGSNNAGVPLTQNQFVTVSGSLSGPAAVSAQGGSAATYTLANNDYTGDTTVHSGTLVLQQATLATNSNVMIASAGVLKLDFGAVTNTIGTLTLNGVGQNPGVYDAGNAAPYLAGAGSLLVTALPIANYATNITSSVSGSTLSLSWPATHLGWILQGQTNSLSTGITATWSDIPGTAAVTATNLSINPANPTVFFRLRHP